MNSTSRSQLNLRPIEREAMRMLLSGDHSSLDVLRHQFAKCKISKRDLTGVGFFVDFRIPADAPTLRKSRVVISDVSADIEGLEYGCGFVLFVDGGVLKTLECHLWGEDEFPSNARHTRMYYQHQPNPPAIQETETRDMDALRRLLG